MNISCGSVVIWWTFTLSISWWTTGSWQTTIDEIPPCHTGRQLLDGGIVALSSLGLTRKKRNYSSSLFPQLLGCTNVHPTWAGTPSCRHYHRLQGATSHAFGKGETAHALVLATLGCNQCPELCLVPMACWN